MIEQEGPLCRAVIVSAPGSNQGKTTIVAALAYDLTRIGLKVSVFKVGPDFIDPGIHEYASGRPVYNLDLWMMGEDEVRRLLHEAALDCDVILIEGVMGLFDSSPSTADLAKLTGIPVLMVIDASSMAQTFAALAEGLVRHDPDVRIEGVVANMVGSSRHEELLAGSLSPDIPYLGSVRRAPRGMGSRHLGLIQSFEIETLDQILDETLAGLNVREAMANKVCFAAPGQKQRTYGLSDMKVAVARDEAFSFIYRGNLDFLHQAGAEVHFFSPIADGALPDCDVIYLPGGYPELYLKELEANQSMKDSIKSAVEGGARIFAECGGFLYLLDEIVSATEERGRMLGLLPGEAKLEKRLQSIGYHYLQGRSGRLNGHSFHYSSCNPGIEPYTHSILRSGSGVGEPVFWGAGIFASYVHFYFPSCPDMVVDLFKGYENAVIKVEAGERQLAK